MILMAVNITIYFDWNGHYNFHKNPRVSLEDNDIDSYGWKSTNCQVRHSLVFPRTSRRNLPLSRNFARSGNELHDVVNVMYVPPRSTCYEYNNRKMSSTQTKWSDTVWHLIFTIAFSLSRPSVETSQHHIAPQNSPHFHRFLRTHETEPPTRHLFIMNIPASVSSPSSIMHSALKKSCVSRLPKGAFTWLQKSNPVAAAVFEEDVTAERDANLRR